MIKMNDVEVWRTYPEFPFIEGSTIGRIRTLDRAVSRGKGMYVVKGHILKQWYNRNGYLLVTFRVNGKIVKRQVHRIIASCFLQNPDSLEQINHKNCVRDDNKIENLEWCSASYNCQYREEHGGASSRSVISVNIKTMEASWFPSRAKAADSLGVYSTSISAVVKGKLKQTGGLWFTNADNNAVEKVRDKFGCTIARKVEQLMSKKESQLI